MAIIRFLVAPQIKFCALDPRKASLRWSCQDHPPPTPRSVAGGLEVTTLTGHDYSEGREWTLSPPGIMGIHGARWAVLLWSLKEKAGPR